MAYCLRFDECRQSFVQGVCVNKGLVALASGAFAFGFAEFVMMGTLPTVAVGVGVSVPAAGNFISAYAIGVCFGTLILVFGHSVAPKRLLLLFMVLAFVGNAGAALAPNAQLLTVARFVSGMPHGAFFGTATIVAKELAQKGREGQAVAIMVLGQTLANTIGVPGGTLLASLVSWRAAFVFVAAWSVLSFLLIARLVPQVPSTPDAGLAGQFRFLGKPGPWMVLGAVLLGNTGLFCWWSYVSPWLTSIGGFAEAALPALLVLGGAGMIVGSQVGGRVADATSSARSAAMGQALSCVTLLLIWAVSGTHVTAALLMFVCCVALFFPSSGQQILMVECGQGGGEMIGSACVQVAFNGGNAIGALAGQHVLDAGMAYNWPALAGVPFAALSVALLVWFALRWERGYHEAATKAKAAAQAE